MTIAFFSYRRLSFSIYCCRCEIFDLVLIEGREACVREIAKRDRLEARALIQTIVGFAHDREQNAPRQANLADMMQKAQTYWKDVRKCGYLASIQPA